MTMSRHAILLRSALALVAAALLIAVAAPVSQAAGKLRTVTWTDRTERDLVGDGCGSESKAVMKLRPGAFDVTLIEPLVGDKVSDFWSELPVATVTSAAFDSGSSTFTWTALGTDDVCLAPDSYLEDGWETDDLPFTVSYKTLEHVYVKDSKLVTKPRKLRLRGGGLVVKRIHWSKWGGKRAIGHGTGSRVGSARAYQVRLKLSAIRTCGDDLRYTKVSYAIRGGGHGRAKLAKGC